LRECRLRLGGREIEHDPQADDVERPPGLGDAGQKPSEDGE
jgi:hypothetical protein